MSKQIRLAIFALTGVSLFFTVLSQPSANSTLHPKQQNPTITTGSRNAALVAATRDVLKETSEIRQLSILRPVQSSAQSRAEIERMIVKNLNEEMTPTQTHAAEVTLNKLGMAAPGFQYRALMIRLLTEQVAGYYDPKTREFHLADWIDLDGQKPVMAHELTHALQDQHFNLRRFEHWPRGDSDAELAAHALIEGDATLAMALYVANNPLRALAFLKSLGAAGMASEELDKAPRAVRETLLFPYQEGMFWVRNLYKQGGWSEVSKAFTALPQSTEQVMHPEKYFAHEPPVKVTLPDITQLLNGRGQRSEIRGERSEVSRFAGSADVPSALSAQREQFWSAATRRRFGLPETYAPDAPGTWKRLDYDVQGEWGFYLILDQFLKSPSESHRAAAGWGGDRFAVYQGSKGATLLVSLSSWDTENDAREFFDAYVKRTGLRYPGAERLESPSSEDQTRNSKPETRDLQSWRTSEGTVIAELRGSRVLILEGIPDRVDSNALLKSLRQW